MNSTTRMAVIRWVSVALVFALRAAHICAQSDDESMRFKRARGYEASGDMDNAGRVYKELYDGDPASSLYFEGLTRAWLAVGKYQDLLAIAGDRAARFPGDVKVQSFVAALLYQTGRVEEGKARWREILDNAGDEIETHCDAVARYQLSVGAVDLAIETWTEGRRSLRSRGLFARELAATLGRSGRIEESTREYIGMLELGASNLDDVEREMAGFLRAPEVIDRAIREVRSAVEARAEYQPFLELLGWLYQEKDDSEGAFNVAKRLDTLRRSSGSEMVRFADRMLSAERYDAAIQALEYFIMAHPAPNAFAPQASLMYVRALESRYRSLRTPSDDDARNLVAKYVNVAEVNRNTPLAAEALLAASHVLANDLGLQHDALELNQQITRDYRNSGFLYDAMVAMAENQISLGKLECARRMLDSLANSRFAGIPPATLNRSIFLLAELDFFEGEFTRASDRFLGLSNDPTADIANDALEYRFLIGEYAERIPAALRNYASGLLSERQHKWAAAAEMYRQAVSAESGSGLADQAQYRRSLAIARNGDPEQCVGVLLDLVVRRPNGLMADRALFGAAEIVDRELHDGKRALALYGQLVNDYPESSFLEEARRRAVQLRGGD